jgi:hypothetical protein
MCVDCLHSPWYKGSAPYVIKAVLGASDIRGSLVRPLDNNKCAFDGVLKGQGNW